MAAASEDSPVSSESSFVKPKKIQTFTFSPPKSDIFLDLEKSNRLQVITLERPTPKLVYENYDEDSSIKDKLRNQFAYLREKSTELFQQGHVFWFRHITPKLEPLLFICEVILCDLLALVGIPLILLWLLGLIIVRTVVGAYLRAKFNDRFTIMSGADAAWGIKRYAHDNCFTSLYIIQGRCSLEKIRRRMLGSLIERRTGDECSYLYEKMRSRITRKFGFFCWEKYPQFNIDEHVKFLDNPNIDGELDERQIMDKMELFFDKTLIDERPQWEMLIVPRFRYRYGYEGLQYYAMIWRLNHSIMDGVSSVQALQYCIADVPVKMSVDFMADTPLQKKWYLRLLTYTNILVFGPRSFIRSMLSQDSNCFHGPELSGPKSLAMSRPLSIQTLRQIKNVMNTCTTATLLSSFAGSLRSLAMRKNLPVPQEILGGATTALLPYKDFGPRNRFTVAKFRLQIGEECKKLRLRHATESVKEYASTSEIMKNFHLIKWTGLNTVKWMERIMDRLQATFILSNVPGSAEPYTMFGGDKLVDVTAWNTIKGRTGIGLCVLSYKGKVRTGIVADGAALNNRGDVQELVQDFEEEILELAKICGIPEDFVFTNN